jgi:hypothetical protein
MKNLRPLRLLALAFIGVATMSAAGFAQDKKPSESVIVPGVRGGPVCSLQLLNSVPMNISNNVMTVQADANGKPLSFQLGTAAIANQMTDAAASLLGLTPATPNYGAPQLTGNVFEGTTKSQTAVPDSPMQERGLIGNPNFAVEQIYDSHGRATSRVVTVADFTLQAMQNKNVDFFVTPVSSPGVDGVFNMDLFRRFDIDLNFAARSFNTFSKDHCKGQILYWGAPGVAALPFFTRDNRIVTHLLLDGKDVTAVIDTASPVSALRFETATRLFGIAPGDSGLTLVGEHHASAVEDLYAHSFKTLSFGTVAIGNPTLMLTRDKLVQGASLARQTGTLLKSDSDDAQPDIIIGMDLLKLTHLYIAQGEQVLYVTQGPELAPEAAGAQPMVPVTPFRP